ncbi:MAG: iron chelate uptake ABC transporter family permease subunit, partial [Flavobacteriaceae bacterium]
MAEVRRASAVPLLAVGAALACAGYMVIGAKGDWAFVLAFRGGKLAALALIACAVAVATVLFQTITANRILTPYVMGFDSLYIALQTALVAALGSGAVSALDPRWRFVLEAALMIVLSLALFRWLFTGGTRSIHLLVLAGIVCGVLFRSVAHLLQRILDPNEFSVLQDLMFANFNTVDTSLLGISCLAVLAVAVVLAPVHPTLDVLALGRESAVGLGVDYRATVTRILAGIAILVSVSAALVGPITFFCLVVASL